MTPPKHTPVVLRAAGRSCRVLENLLRIFACATILLLLLTAPGCKKKVLPPPEKPMTLRVEGYVYRLPRALAVTEVFGQPRNVDGTALLKRVQALTGEKKATLVATTALATHSGQRAVVESILEHRFPTEFEPPQIPQTFGGNFNNPPKTGTTTTKTVTTSVTTETTEVKSTNNTFPMTPTTPTAFETRNCGMTLECEPVYDKEVDTISINAVFQLVELLRTIQYPTENGGFIEQPIFYARKITTSATVKNGGVVFLGTFDPDKSVSKDDDMTEVVFFRMSNW